MLKIGVIGTGGIAYHRMLPAILKSKRVQVVALMDQNEQVLEDAASAFSVENCYTDLAAFVRDEEINAVYIATPVFVHKEQVIACLRAGKNVLVEKPAGLTVEECLVMEREQEVSGMHLKVGFLMRYHELHQKIRQLVSSGELGDIISCEMRFSCDFPKQEGSWRQTWELSGGGSMMDMGIHAIDLTQYIVGEKPTDVFCSTRNIRYDYEVEDSSDLFWSTETGTTVHIASHFAVSSAIAPSKICILGTCGSVEAIGTLSQEGTGKAEILTSTGRQIISYKSEDLYQKEIEKFADDIEHGTEEKEQFASAIFAQRIIEAGYSSSENKQVIQFSTKK